ncbi:MAG TPA: XRE family transcriptional regulator [Sedimentisphaerales bacterium]|nr:XRE family transcriptional regulator [Sedimentisphaerales bacterium]
MARPFKNLVEKMSPQSRRRIRERTAAMHTEMPLQELRQAMQLTQQELAERLDMNQAAISKLEHQSDMYVSTLRRFVAAMGGELQIVARFPQGDVVISQFEDIQEREPAAKTT